MTKGRKPLISVVIAYRNDPFINYTLAGLPSAISNDRVEIIVVDDASDEPYDCPYDGVKVIRTNSQRGVGYSFDRGIEIAQSENIVFMGSDVIVKNKDWATTVLEFNKLYPKSLGCSVCLSGDPEHLTPNEPANDTKRYGAVIMPFATTEDLPSDSPILYNASYYVGAFDCRWIKQTPVEKIQEVPAIYGAFYFTTKSWYKHIGGFDTIGGRKLSGFSFWGSLEPWIAIKNYLYGGKCYINIGIESLHVFHKMGNMPPPNGRPEMMWWNKIFLAIMVMDDIEDAERLLKKVQRLREKYELHTLPFNMGKKLIRYNWDYVLGVREYHQGRFVNSFSEFLDYFNIERKW